MSSFYAREDRAVEGSMIEELERERDQLDTAFTAVQAAIVAASYGIRYVVDSYGDLVAAAGEEEFTLAVVRNDAGAPSGNGLYRVESGAWVFFDKLNLQDASEVAFDNATSGLAAIEIQAALDEIEARVDTNDAHTATTTGNPHSIDAADAGAEPAGAIATHAAIATAHQNAPALIETHKGDATAHQDAPVLITAHAGDAVAHQDAPALITAHAGLATAHQDAPALITAHAGDAVAHQDAPALITTHAGLADAHHAESHDAASHSDIAKTGAEIDGAVDHAAVSGNPHSVPYAIIIPSSDEVTDLTVGTAKVTFRMPKAMVLTGVRASVNTAPTDASLIVDINEGGVSILSTKLSIDATEKTSTTAVTPAVISDANLADDAEITVDIDQIGSTLAGKGLKIYLIGA